MANIDHVEAIVERMAEYITDTDSGKIIDQLREIGVDINDRDDVASNFGEACNYTNVPLEEYFDYATETMATYNSQCLKIVEESNYYSGWDELADMYGGGQIDNIAQLAYFILKDEFNAENGLEEVGRYFFDAYLDKFNE